MDLGKILLIGAGGWVVWHMLQSNAGATSALPPAPGGGAAPTPPALPQLPPGSPPPEPVPPNPPRDTFNTLDAIYQRMVTAVGSNPMTADGFNYYLAMQLPAGKTPPDPLAVFTAAGWNRETPMPFAIYWTAMAPYLKTNLGLSGVGFYGGLGQYIRTGRG